MKRLALLCGFAVFGFTSDLSYTPKSFNISDDEVRVHSETLPSYLKIPTDEIRRATLQNRLFAKEFIEKNGISKDLEIEMILEIEKLLSKKYQTQMMDKIKTDEKVLKSYYLDNLNSFKLPPKIHSSDIVVNNLKEAQEIHYKLVHEKANFEELAKEKSIDPTKSNGGKLPVTEADKFVFPLMSFVEMAEEGSISSPIKVGEQYHIMKLEKREVQATDYESVKDIIRDRLLMGIKVEQLLKETERLKKVYGDKK